MTAWRVPVLEPDWLQGLPGGQRVIGRERQKNQWAVAQWVRCLLKVPGPETEAPENRPQADSSEPSEPVELQAAHRRLPPEEMRPPQGALAQPAVRASWPGPKRG
jgi:hypothetical protein